MIAANKGQIIQVLRIFVSVAVSVAWFEKRSVSYTHLRAHET